MRGSSGAHPNFFAIEPSAMSLAEVIGVVIEEGLTALTLSHKDGSAAGPHTAGLVRLRRLLFRLAVGAMILATVSWGVAAASDLTTGRTAALAGYWAFGVALAAVFGWAVSFGSDRPWRR